MTQANMIKIHPSWKKIVKQEFNKDYMLQLKQFLRAEKEAAKVIYPPCKQWFNAFDSTPFDSVKVVILGQDPYHGPGQAHGLCFSVLPGVASPPSLSNIFQAIHNDIDLPIAQQGCLQTWAEQGVLLLNAVLTVQAGRAASHQGKGWEIFTDYVVQQLNEQREGLVFLLWGSYAQRKGQLIDSQKHLVLKAPHPSPLSAYRGFLNCAHFSKANAYLGQQSKEVIDWSVPYRAPL